jgi:hypothetical protein
MFRNRKIQIAFFLFFLISGGCGEIVTYPDVPILKYKNFSLYVTQDDLGNSIFLGKMEATFTDGDGDIGLFETDSSVTADTLKYNFFTNVYNYNNGVFEKVDSSEGVQNFRIPDISRKGQNKTLKGSIFVDFEYYFPIKYDTIFYTFYLMDQQFHRSNIDTSDVIIFPAKIPNGLN